MCVCLFFSLLGNASNVVKARILMRQLVIIIINTICYCSTFHLQKCMWKKETIIICAWNCEFRRIYMVYDLFLKTWRNWTDGGCCRHLENLIKISTYTCNTNLFTLGLVTDCCIQSLVSSEELLPKLWTLVVRQDAKKSVCRAKFA